MPCGTASRSAGRTPRLSLPPAAGHWSCTLQGELLKVQFHQAWPALPKACSRGPAGLFSRESRKRLLDKINAIDHAKVKRGLFLTWTYPDHFTGRSFKQRNQDTFLMWRHLEKFMGRQVPVLWRIEWKRRKTGKLVGNLAPHVHMVAFDYEYIPMELWNRWAKEMLGWDGYLNTDVRAMKNGLHCLKYLAKYVSKPDDVSLVVAAKLNNLGGRTWGIKRPGLIPWATPETVCGLPQEVVRYACNVAADLGRGYLRERPDSFTMYGKAARLTFEAICEHPLTRMP